MSWKSNRKRNIRHTILFSEDEWNQASMRYQVEHGRRKKSFSAWARTALIEPFTVTVTVNTDTDKLNTQVTGLSNNINQIAHTVNTNKTADEKTLTELYSKLDQIKDLLEKLREDNQILIEHQLTAEYKKR